jgi:release factor glutamine methyltransferase
MPLETLASLRKWGAGTLRAADIGTPDLDARLLLQHAAGLAHEDLAADPGRAIEGEMFRILINRRLAHEPVSRILGAREFYGREFIVTAATLDPRPDTETLIAEALSQDAATVLDLGTGTGAIAVTLLAERPSLAGTATDISAEALKTARLNAARHGAGGRLSFVHCNWFDGVGGRFDLVVSNPPYIPLGDIASLEPDVKHFDPHRALDGGPDGLEAYRRIASGAAAHLAPDGRIVLEIGAGQEAPVVRIFETAGFSHVRSARDLGGHPRALTFHLPPL